MHQESSQRLLLSMTALAAIWIVVYWSWGPSEMVPTVSFDDRPSEVQAENGIEPAILIGEPAETGRGPLSQIPTITQGETLRVQPPRFNTYTVRAGETLEDIAMRVYGDRSLWRVVAQANPLKDAARIQAGDVLRVPVDPSNIQGVVVDADGDRAEPPAQAEPVYVEYVVKSGDTLGEIAQQYYGTARHARLIFEANTDQLRNMNDLKLGQTLRLPAAPSTDE